MTARAPSGLWMAIGGFGGEPVGLGNGEEIVIGAHEDGWRIAHRQVVITAGQRADRVRSIVGAQWMAVEQPGRVLFLYTVPRGLRWP
jgi:hypothetical protein